MGSRIISAAICFLAGWLSSVAMAAELTGRVIELHSGLPVEQARVSVVRLANDRPGMTAETSDEGGFSVPGMVPGCYRIEASKPGYAASALFVTFERDAAVVVRLAKGGVISGRVMTDAGAPVLDASVFPLVKTPGAPALRRLGAARSIVGRVDDRGFYRLYGLPPGDYAVAVSYSGAGTTSGSGVTIIPDNRTPRLLSIASGEEYENISLTVTPGQARSIEGHIDPIESRGAILVTLTLQDQPGIAVAQTLVDGKGRFRFGRVQPGSYYVLAAGPSELNGGFGGLLGRDPVFGRAEVSVTYQDEKDLSVPMRSGRTMAFRLGGADPTAKSAACGSRAALQLTAIDEWGARIDRKVEVNVESATAVSGVAPARFFVTVSGLPDSCYYFGDPVLDFTATAPETVMLRLAPGASLEGRLATAGRGNPADYIVLIWPDAPADGEPVCLMVVPNPEGLFSVEALRPGHYRVLATSLSEWSGSQWKPDVGRMVQLQLTPGVTRLELPLPVSLDEAGTKRARQN